MTDEVMEQNDADLTVNNEQNETDADADAKIEETEETELTDSADAITETDVEVVPLSPEQTILSSITENEEYAIELQHTFTLGDALIVTLLTVLIVVTLLSRLIGGR